MSTVEKNTPYDSWKTDPTPQNLKGVVDYLRPTVNHVLFSINAGDDPYIKSRANVLTAKAVQSFDPNQGAGLSTWVSRQLMPLRRIRRQSQSAVRVPEGIQIDAYNLMRSEQDFFDKYEREPDVYELADHSKMPVKRIEHIRKVFRPIPSEAAFSSEENPDGFSGVTSTESQFGSEAFEYVYRDADHLDRRILEMKTGFGGSPVMSGKEIAAKLGLTEPQLSRRSAKLSIQINDLEDALKNL